MAKKITFEEFEKRANEKHGGKYIYHKETFNGTKHNTTITCPIHGDFPQTPKRHMNGQGCPECGKEKARTYHKHNYKPFLEEAYKRFGNDFSFPLIESQYVNNKTYITVRCNKCGYEFSRRPNDLFSDKFNGCKNCKHIETIKKREKTKILKEKIKDNIKKDIKNNFFESLYKKFGNTITPFSDEFVNMTTEMHFKCNKCGHIFSKTPFLFIRSNGCQKCKCSSQKLTTEEFIQRAKKIHGDKYDYSESEYKSTDEDVIVICHEKDEFGEEHGRFKVTPHAHIGSMHSGCPKCSGKFRKDTDYFIRQAKRIHGDKYIYAKTQYVKALEDVIITCPIHGDFQLTPNEHLNGRGCPLCKESHLEKEIRLFLDENGIKYIPQARFDWLRTNDTRKKMSLDYLIKDKNIAIECQGIQHFNAKRFWPTERSKEQAVLRVQERDKLKKQLCEEHGIKVLYYSNLGIEYPYHVFTDKEELLKEITK